MEQAIAAYTTGSAFAEFAEKKKAPWLPACWPTSLCLIRTSLPCLRKKFSEPKCCVRWSGWEDGVYAAEVDRNRTTKPPPLRSAGRIFLVFCYSRLVSRSLKAHILLVLITLIWGSNFVVIKNALADISPLFFNAVRMSLAAVVLAAVFHRELRRLTAGSLRSGLLVGVFLFVGNELQTVGLKYTTPSKSAFLTGVSVVLVPVLLALFWKRSLNRWMAAGVVLAVAGLYLLTVPASAGAGLNLRSMNQGDLFTLGAALVFAFHIIFIEHATRTQGWQQITVVQVAVTAVLMILTVPLAEKVSVVWSSRVSGESGLPGF